MFTPPSSPRRLSADEEPISTSRDVKHYIEDLGVECSACSPSEIKRRIARRTKWTVIIVPLVLIFITASTRYLTHPIAFDLISEPPSGTEGWHAMASKLTDWTPHKPHPEVRRDIGPSVTDNSKVYNTPSPMSEPAFPSSATSTSTSTKSSSADTGPTLAASQTLPSIPSSPPVLPTPFPQPFDQSLTNNFSTTGCYNFFLNMTNTLPFRSCRPFSLLLQSSAEFVNAQSNITSANIIQWGTCNTDTSQTQCVANMAWFANELQINCDSDLAAQNAMVIEALQGLQAYKLMHDTGCLADQSTDTYCYIEAVHSLNPADLYLYQLPLGTPFPSKTTPSCSTCAKSVMALYADALGTGTESVLLGDGLKATYSSAAQLAQSQCGQGYVLQMTSGGITLSATRMLRLLGVVTLMLVGCAVQL